MKIYNTLNKIPDNSFGIKSFDLKLFPNIEICYWKYEEDKTKYIIIRLEWLIWHIPFSFKTGKNETNS